MLRTPSSLLLREVQHDPRPRRLPAQLRGVAVPVAIVCGSRGWTDRKRLESRLDRLLDQNPGLVVRHGCCPRGADEMASTWCKRRGVTEERFPAEWHKYGRRAGYLRNVEMAQAEPKAFVCLAFWDGESPGTGGMLEEADREGIPAETEIDVR